MSLHFNDCWAHLVLFFNISQSKSQPAMFLRQYTKLRFIDGSKTSQHIRSKDSVAHQLHLPLTVDSSRTKCHRIVEKKGPRNSTFSRLNVNPIDN